MGRYFGWANQYLMLLACLAVIAMAASGIVMWARRRGARGLAAPPLRFGGMSRSLVITLVVLACMLPVFGASLLLLQLAERCAARFLTPLETA
jgi:uncharacterized iron-regulated membrane protein